MLRYRIGAGQTRTLQVVGPVGGVPLFAGSGASTPRLEAGLAETRRPTSTGTDATTWRSPSRPRRVEPPGHRGHVGVASFTQDLGVRGQQSTALTGADLYFEGQAPAQRATRGLRLAPALVRIDPEAGYTMERRQLAVRLDRHQRGDPRHQGRPSTRSIRTRAARRRPVSSPSTRSRPPGRAFGGAAERQRIPAAAVARGRWIPRSRDRGGAAGVGLADWPTASAKTSAGAADPRLYTRPSTPTAPGERPRPDHAGRHNLNPIDLPGRTELYTVTAFDPAGASLVLGAPAVVQVQGLRRATMLAAQPPVHADWDWNITNPNTHAAGAFATSRASRTSP